MAKITTVKIKKVSNEGTIVYTPDNEFFIIKSLDEGVLHIENIPDNNVTIQRLAEIASGCFEVYSSFFGVRWINLTYNNVTVHVTKSDPVGYIVTKWEITAKAKR